MCGRYALAGPHRLTKAQLAYLDGLQGFAPSYNVAPTAMMPIVRLHADKPQLAVARWGLVPFWAKDPKIGNKMINARAETVAQKPAYRYSYQDRRCLVPASGYFEWQKHPTGKQPYYFTSREGSLLTFAGLWEYWKPKDAAGEPIVSYTIIVGEPNPFTNDIHDRMPIIIEQKDWNSWLTDTDPARFLQPCRDDLLQVHPVSTRVNKPENNDASLIEPIANVGRASSQSLGGVY